MSLLGLIDPCLFDRKFLLVLILCFSVFQVRLIQANSDEDEILKRYEPVAVEESWSYVKPSGEVVVSEPSRTIIARRPAGSKRISNYSDSVLSDEEILITNYTRGKTELVDIKDSKGKDISRTLFRLPKNESVELARLVTSGSSPTLVRETAAMPQTKNSDSKVLASYKLVIPLFVPAIKSKNNAQNIDYLAKTETQMVPVKKIKPKVRKVIKAEQVPERVITQYVRTDGSPLTQPTEVMPNYGRENPENIDLAEQI